MLSLRQLPLRSRLTATLLIACVFSLAVSAIVAGVMQWRSVRARAVRELTAQAGGMALALRSTVVRNDAASAEAVLASVAFYPNVRAGAAYLPDGALFAKYARTAADAQTLPDVSSEGYRFRGGVLELWQPVQGETRPIARLFLRRDLRPDFVETAWPLAGGLAGLVAGALLSLWLAHGLRHAIGDPVRLLTKAAETLTEKRDYSLRVPQIARHELAELTDAFNALVADFAGRTLAATKSEKRTSAAPPAPTPVAASAPVNPPGPAVTPPVTPLASDDGWAVRLLDASPEFIALARADRGMLFLNRAGREQLGLKPSDALPSMRLDELLGESARAEISDTILPAATRGGAWKGEVTWRTRKGHTLALECSIVAHRDAAGAAEFFAITGRDTDAVERAPQEILENEERLRMTLDTAQTGTWQWNAVANEVVWDAIALRLFGKTAETFGGTHEAFLECVHPDDRSGIESALVRAFADARFYQAEFRVVLADGRVQWLASLGRVQRDADGRPARMIGVVHEIAPREATGRGDVSSRQADLETRAT